MRKLATVAMVAGLLVGGVGAAVADGWRTLPVLWTAGAEFSRGDYKWEPKGQNRGGFHFRGTLSDIKPDDGHNVYVQVKVEAYGWNRLNGVQRKSVKLDKVVWDGAAQYTSTADIRVCRDRGSLRPDNCSHTQSYRR